MTTYTGMCTCAAGCARNPMADPGVFGDDCSCWCHTRRDRVTAPAGTRPDPLLAALADAQQRKQRADQHIRLLLAYAREHVQPRPYRLADLAQAAGMSTSGARTAYTQADIEQAARLTGGSRGRRLLAVITSLLINGRTAPGHHPAA
jgi:hypothetical protein